MTGWRAGLVCLAVAAVVVGLAGSAAGDVLLFGDDFENVDVGQYPAVNGWIPLSGGKSGIISNAPAPNGSNAFRLESWLFYPRLDCVRLGEAPTRVAYEASVYVDTLSGRTGVVGFADGPAEQGLMWNYFRVDRVSRRVIFEGAEPVVVGTYTPGTWCTVRADLDYGTLKGYLWVNGAAVPEPVDIAPGGAVGEPMQFGVSATSDFALGPGYLGNVVYFDNIAVWELETTIEVGVDVKPGSYPNSINLRSRGLLPVAILSDEGFDATEVDPATVLVAGAMVVVRSRSCHCMAHLEDVNGDGLVDMVVHVATQDLDRSQLEEGYAVVTGSTLGGQEFVGWDEVRLVPRR